MSRELRVACPVLNSLLSWCNKSLGSVRVIETNIMKKGSLSELFAFPHSKTFFGKLHDDLQVLHSEM